MNRPMYAGSGLSNGKLALANASVSDVLSGKKFYAGDKNIKTGTLALSGNASPSDVISGKTFYSGDPKSKQTGTLVDLGYEPDAQGGMMYDGKLYFYIGENSGNRRWALTRGVAMPQQQVADIIGLTADKIYTGNSIIGVAGTGGSNLSGSGNKSQDGNRVEIRRDEGNHLAYANSYVSATVDIYGRAVHVRVTAGFHLDADGVGGLLQSSGNHSETTFDLFIPIQG